MRRLEDYEDEHKEMLDYMCGGSVPDYKGPLKKKPVLAASDDAFTQHKLAKNKSIKTQKDLVMKKDSNVNGQSVTDNVFVLATQEASFPSLSVLPF